MNRIMVTGASTALGIELIQSLLSDDTIEIILAIGDHHHSPLPEQGNRLRYQRVNLNRTRQIHNLLFGPARELKIQTIIDVGLNDSHSDRNQSHPKDSEVTRELLIMTERHPTICHYILRSYAEAYQRDSNLPSLIPEDHPLDLSSHHPAWLRDRIAADLAACSRMGMIEAKITVLRCAECLAHGVGSQLYDYLGSEICLIPMGFDPMINVISLPDLVLALRKTIQKKVQGVFNIPGADTLPLSLLIKKWGRRTVSLPSALLGPAYSLRALAHVGDFMYRHNRHRFHFGGVLDGRCAQQLLDYRPRTPIAWPGARIDSQNLHGMV